MEDGAESVGWGLATASMTASLWQQGPGLCWWQRSQRKGTGVQDTQAVGDTRLGNWVDVRADVEA